MDLIYIDTPFNSDHNDDAFWGETNEKHAFEDRLVSAQAYIELMRPRRVDLHGILKSTRTYWDRCDWHASQYSSLEMRNA